MNNQAITINTAEMTKVVDVTPEPTGRWLVNFEWTRRGSNRVIMEGYDRFDTREEALARIAAVKAEYRTLRLKKARITDTGEEA